MRGYNQFIKPREVALRLDEANKGQLNNNGTVTLTANQSTTTVQDPNVHEGSIYLFEPTTANALAEYPNIRVTTKNAASFIITHSNLASTDRTFNYVYFG